MATVNVDTRWRVAVDTGGFVSTLSIAGLEGAGKVLVFLVDADHNYAGEYYNEGVTPSVHGIFENGTAAGVLVLPSEGPPSSAYAKLDQGVWSVGPLVPSISLASVTYTPTPDPEPWAGPPVLSHRTRVRAEGALPDHTCLRSLDEAGTYFASEFREYRGASVDGVFGSALGTLGVSWVAIVCRKGDNTYTLLVEVDPLQSFDYMLHLDEPASSELASTNGVHVPAKNNLVGLVASAPSGAPDRHIPHTLTITVTREGAPTAEEKTAKLSLSDTDATPAAYFYVRDVPVKQYFGADLLGTRYLAVTDTTIPKLGSLRWPEITLKDTELLFDLSAGGAAVTGGVPATVDARVFLDSQPSARDVVLLERTVDAKWRLLTFDETDVTGDKTLEFKAIPGSQVFGVSKDDYGVEFTPDRVCNEGDRIRPTQFIGWVYDVEVAGTLPSTEPMWWPVEGDNVTRVIGSVTLRAARYYQPIAHGPVPVTWKP